MQNLRIKFERLELSEKSKTEFIASDQTIVNDVAHLSSAVIYDIINKTTVSLNAIKQLVQSDEIYLIANIEYTCTTHIKKLMRGVTSAYEIKINSVTTLDGELKYYG